MIVDRIVLKNFGIFKDVDITLPQGVIGVIGRHIDGPPRSNASGKTTFLESIPFSVTGKLCVDDSPQDLVGDYGDDMFSQVFFKGDKEYTIKRGLEGGVGLIEYLINKVSIDATKPDLKKKIFQDFGYDYEMLMASHFFQQANHDTFTNQARPTKRKEYIRKARGVGILDECYKLVSTRKQPILESLETNKSEIKVYTDNLQNTTDPNKEIKELEEKIYKLATNKKSVELKKEEYIVKNSENETIKNQVQANTKTCENHQKMIEDFNEANISLKSKNKEIKKKIEDLEKTLQVEDTKEKESKLFEELHKIETSILYNQEKFKTFILENIDDEKFVELSKDLQQFSNQLLLQNSDLNNQNELYTKFKNYDSPVCQSCFQEVSEEHIEKQKNNLVEKITSLKNSINSLTEQKNDIQEVLDELSKKQQTNKEIEKSREKILKKISELNQKLKEKNLEISSHMNIEKVQIEKQRMAIASIQENRNIYDSNLKTLQSNENQIEVLKKEIQELNTLNIELNQQISKDYTSSLEALSKEIESLDEEITENRQRVATLKTNAEQIKVAQEKIVEIEKNNQEIGKKLGGYEKLEFAYSKNGISNSFVQETILELSDLANRYLWQIDPTKTIVFETKTKTGNETLDIKILDKGRVRPYRRYSGGEKTTLNIAIRLALSQILNKSEKKLDFLVMDEVFGQLDEIGQNLISQLIAQVRNSFSQIFVISHTDMKDQFEHLLEVHRYKDYATIQLVR